MKTFLPYLISKEILRFVEGRQISDNVILVQEVAHSLNTQERDGMIMQLYLSKAYEKIN